MNAAFSSSLRNLQYYDKAARRTTVGRLSLTTLLFCFAMVAGSSASAQIALPANGFINTVTGNGTGGYSGDGGAATSAALKKSFGVAVDSSGNIYIADTYNNVIRKVTASTGYITTVAGTGTAGYSGDGGFATSATLNLPSGIAIDSSGNIYIADADNNCIRMVTASTGNISTVAGNGMGGYSGDGGAASNATLNYPHGVAIDSSNNIYIADTSNNVIRMVTASTGNITTVAGNGTGGYSGDGWPATSYELYYPNGIALDSSGNIYIADQNNNRIRKVSVSTGYISTVAGNGTSGFSGDGETATAAELYYPFGIALDSSGNIYIADTFNNRVREVIASTGYITTATGNGMAGYFGDGGVAISAGLQTPYGIAVDSSNNLYIADTGNNRIRAVGVSTPVSVSCSSNPTTYGNGTTCTAAVMGTNLTGTVEWDVNSSLWKTDTLSGASDSISGLSSYNAGSYAIMAIYSGDNNNLLGFGSTTLTISKLPQIINFTAPASPVPYGSSPIALVATGGASGNPVVFSIVSGPAQLSGSSLTITGYGTVVVAANQAGNINYSAATQVTQRIQVINDIVLPSSGTISTVAGSATRNYSGDGGLAINAGLNQPAAVAVDSSGNIYVADYLNLRVRKVTALTDVISTVAGNGTSGYSGDGGQATSATLSVIYGVAVDSFGNIYVADKNNNRVRKVTASTGIITTVAGTGSPAFSGDGGLASSATLNQPFGVAVDSFDNLYIADTKNNRIRKVTLSTGKISTVAGSSSSIGYSGDGGLATSAMLNAPQSIAIDSFGNMYIADTANQVIRTVSASTGYITTVAGTGTVGFSGDGGLATSAKFNGAAGVAVDPLGNIYVADQTNCRIRKIMAQTGIIGTIAGTGLCDYSGDGGLATSAKLYYPQGVATDSFGNIYVADQGNSRIRAIGAATNFGVSCSPTSIIFGAGSTCKATVMGATPTGTVTWQVNGSLWQTDTLSGTTDTISGFVTQSPGTYTITAIYSGDSNNKSGVASTVLTINQISQTINFTAPTSPVDNADLPIALVATGGASGNPVVFSIVSGPGTISGSTLTVTGAGTIVIAANQAGNTNYSAGTQVTRTVVLYWKSQAINFTAPTSPVTYGVSPITLVATGGASGNPVTFSVVSGLGTVSGNTLTITGSGNVVVAANQAGNAFYGAATQVTKTVIVNGTSVYNGIITTVAGTGSAGFSGDGGLATSATLHSNRGVAVDSLGHIYIVDAGNNRIRMLTVSTGIITTVAGTGTAGFSGDGGLATSAMLNNPYGVAVDCIRPGKAILFVCV